MFRHLNIKIFGALLLFMLTVAPLSKATDPASEINFPATLYIVPFLNVMTPPTVSSRLFDTYIDELMATGESYGMTIRILKRDIDQVDREWLAKQHFITGELFGYVEDSGCCSTEINAKVRTYLYRPGSIDPAGEIVVPGDIFFDHDLSTLEAGRIKLADRMGRNLAQQLFADLARSAKQQ